MTLAEGRSGEEASRSGEGHAYKGHTMKIIVCCGWMNVVRFGHTTPAGGPREVCFFKTEEETEEELRAWGYPLLVEAYPSRADRSRPWDCLNHRNLSSYSLSADPIAASAAKFRAGLSAGKGGRRQGQCPTRGECM